MAMVQDILNSYLTESADRLPKIRETKETAIAILPRSMYVHFLQDILEIVPQGVDSVEMVQLENREYM